METIIYIVDKKGSALHTAALSRVSLSGGKVYIANEYMSPRILLKNIFKENSGVILFAWRKALADYIFLKSSRKYYKKLDSKFVIVFLIPDHLGLNDRKQPKELAMISAVDYELVTSQILLDKYRDRYVDDPPKGILHDLPNLIAIDNIKKNIPKIKGDKQKIIWVGNSGWGARQGATDHKGLADTIVPLNEIIKQHNNCVDLEIVDSKKKFIKHKDVLEKIRTSDLLIQVSKSEGTGLPLLEAIGLETSVLTTDVGVAKEILSDPQYFIDGFDDAEEIHNKIHQLLEKRSAFMLSDPYNKYIGSILKEELEPLKKINIMPIYATIKNRINIRLFWYYRYFDYLTSKILNKVE
jgi:glycosyltransferase involved in cell wall biosynthesis